MPVMDNILHINHSNFADGVLVEALIPMAFFRGQGRGSINLGTPPLAAVAIALSTCPAPILCVICQI